jgi:hypothetical protein
VSDLHPDRLDEALRLLREPVTAAPEARRRIMDAVLASPRDAIEAASAPSSSVSALRIRPRRSARGPALSTLAVAAGLAGIMTLGLERPGVFDRLPGRSAVAFSDTVAATLRDTVRLVQFMLVAPAASRVALVGEFNEWSERATPLSRPSAESPWTVALSLPPGRHRYAFVVDDTQWVRGALSVQR